MGSGRIAEPRRGDCRPRTRCPKSPSCHPHGSPALTTKGESLQVAPGKSPEARAGKTEWGVKIKYTDGSQEEYVLKESSGNYELKDYSGNFNTEFEESGDQIDDFLAI